MEEQVAISSPGIGSNLDVNGIVSKLMQVESQPLTSLQQKEAAYTSELSAFGTLSGALSSFQSSLAGLDASKFKTLNATSSDTDILTATTAKDAVKGSYKVNITQLAQAQTIATAGQASTTATIGTGAATTLTFSFGTISGGTLANGLYSGATFTQDADQATHTLTINSSNNSLQGIRDAINNAGMGVTATIVSDGSATPNRLVLTSDKTGAKSSMKISVAGDPALQNLLGYEPDGTQNLSQSSAAQSAALTVNGVAITSATNTIEGAIQGVTLTAADVGNSTLSVSADTSGIKTGLNAFIKAYNDLNTTINNLTSYDAKTKKAGPLLGDATVRSIQTAVRRMFGTAVPGLNGSLTNLSQIGVSFQKDGSLSLDSTKLQNAITANFDDVTKLLAASGSASDSLVNFVSSRDNTPVGTSSVYVSQLATQGKVAGGGAAGLSIVAGANDKLDLTIDGVSASTTLVPGTYTAATLASQVQAAINGVKAFSSAGIAVTVTQNAGVLTITSNKYGSASNVTVGGNGAANLLPTPTATTGVDVAGTIGGVAATGSGQYLTGSSGSPADGVKVQITGGSAPASRGTVNVSKGYGYQFKTLLENFVGSKGLIASKNDGINATIKTIQKQEEALNTRLTAIEARYRKQFTNLDVLMGNMTKTSTFLTQQLAALKSSS